MCAPALSAVAGIAMGGLQAVASFGAAQADYNAKAEQWRQNVVNSEAAARDDQRQLINRQLQEQAKTTQENHISYLKQAEKQSSVEVSAAQGNVSGISVDNLLADIAGKSELNRTYADQNYKYIAADIQERLWANNTTLASRINSVTRPTSPSALSLIAGIGGSAVKGFSSLSTSGGSLGD